MSLCPSCITLILGQIGDKEFRIANAIALGIAPCAGNECMVTLDADNRLGNARQRQGEIAEPTEQI